MATRTPFQNHDIAVGNSNAGEDLSGIPPGTSGQVLTSNGPNADPSFQDAGGGASAFITKYRTTDGTPVNNSTVLVADDVLKFNIDVNEVWAFEMRAIFVSPTQTPDMIASFSGPASPAQVAISFIAPANDTACWQNDLSASPILDAFGQQFDSPSNVMSAANTPSPILANGIVRNGPNAGTVTFMWAQQNATAEDSMLKAGSYLIAHKLA